VNIVELKDNISYFYKNEQLDIHKPIFIIGVPRSGTTLLYQLLAQHPSLGWFSNHTWTKLLNADYLHHVNLRRRIFDMRNLSYPLDGFVDSYFSSVESPIEGGYLWDLLFGMNWNCSITKNMIPFLKNTILETLKHQRKSRFLSKVPRNAIRIHAITKIFPDAKFIHLLRDGRAVVNSMLVRAKENPSGYFGIPLRNTPKSTLNAIEKHALQWIQVIEEIKKVSKQLKKNQYFELKYEELVRFPEKNLKSITSFCELHPFIYEYKKVDPNLKLDKKKYFALWDMPEIQNRNLEYENNDRIEKYLSSTLQELNYL